MRPLKASIIRNFLILALSIALVLATQTVQKRVRAGTVTDNIDRYVDLFLEGKDFKTECEEPETPALIDPRDRVGRVINKYHDAVNCLFNVRIKILVEKMLKGQRVILADKPLSEEDLKAILKNLSPPPPLPPDPETGQSMGREDCSNEGDGRNLSTYCLAKVATEEYFAFRRALVVARKQAKNEAAQNLPKNYPTKGGDTQPIELLGKNIQEYGAVIEKINRELEISREALDQGLAAYQELQMALPLHRKYMEVIKKLEKYRDEVADIRDQVSLYPTVFLDVTTTQCN
jgi:hypothetical protein